ncbi:MAG TPA: S8 family serine peptidase [Candidatus Acidoferrum sp.]|nr:S8 family serine peptidase [Candidatus Acidoferrum sp.]
MSYRPSGGRAPQSLDRAAGVVRSLDLAGTDAGIAHRVVTLASGADATAMMGTLRAMAGVTNVAPVHLRFLAADSVANDPLLDTTRQWYLYKTNVDAGGWALSHGSSAVSVAVIDTGVDESNTDFTFTVKESVINGVKTTGNGTVQDTDGHGTNVAGLATALTNNGLGFAGVGYSTPLQAYKIFPNETTANPCPTASTADEATAIRDAVTNGASVINLSLGSVNNSSNFDQAEADAVAFAIANNVTVVAAGGNEFQQGTGNLPDFPAAYPGVIAVGASAVQDTVADNFNSITAETVASYSNSGVTLVAPGGDANGTSDTDTLHWIEGYSTTTAGLPANQCSNSGGVCAVLFNGTSQSTPQVAGTVALMEAFHGGARSLSPSAVTQLLKQTADLLPGIASARQGAGRLNTGKAVAAAK